MEKYSTALTRPATRWSEGLPSSTQVQTRFHMIWQVQPWRFRVPSANVRAIEKMDGVTQAFLAFTLIATIGFLASLFSDAEGAVVPLFYSLVALFFGAFLLVFAQTNSVAREFGKFIFGFFGIALVLLGVIVGLVVSSAFLALACHR